jgi:hypothetical protein
LLKLGIDIGETSVGKYLVRSRKPPSQTWWTFLENHVKTMVLLPQLIPFKHQRAGLQCMIDGDPKLELHHAGAMVEDDIAGAMHDARASFV